MAALLAPALFVLIWSTGFIVARAAVPHADPELFIAVRVALVALWQGASALIAREAWPRGRRLGLHLLSGMMLPGLYLSASWWAVAHRMPAGIMALLGALTPLLVALIGFAMGQERLALRSWGGLAIGAAGVALVLGPAIGPGVGGISPWVVALSILAVLGTAGATLIQHRHLARDPLWASGALQNLGALIVAVPAAVAAGSMRWDGTPALWAALAWSVLGLSVAALSLLAWMLRHQGATTVSALFLLTPPLAAAEAWALFGERLSPAQLAGFVMALGGVLLARARRRAEAIAEPAFP